MSILIIRVDPRIVFKIQQQFAFNEVMVRDSKSVPLVPRETIHWQRIETSNGYDVAGDKRFRPGRFRYEIVWYHSSYTSPR